MIETLIYISLFLALVNIVMLVGIVLRVEQRLDLSFKFILYAAVILTVSFGIDLLVQIKAVPEWSWNVLFKFLFVILFTIGIWEMRRLTRILDGEIKERRK